MPITRLLRSLERGSRWKRLITPLSVRPTKYRMLKKLLRSMKYL